MSSVNEVRIWVRFSRSMPAWSEPTSSCDHMTSLVMRTPIGLLAAISRGDLEGGVDHPTVGHDPGHEAELAGRCRRR